MESEKFGRLSDADWFKYLNNKEALVIGQGGIGSYLSFFLSRIGINLTTYDGDIYEIHNMSGQLINEARIGENKATAIAAICAEFAGENWINVKEEMYTENSSTCPITLCGLDNMKARKIAFEAWEKVYKEDKNAIFIDGRCLINQFQVFTIQGGDVKAINEYKTNWLFTDEEAAEAPCSFKQSSHIASMTASSMTNILTNWAENQYKKMKIFSVPFKTEFIAGLNKFTIDYDFKIQ